MEPFPLAANAVLFITWVQSARKTKVACRWARLLMNMLAAQGLILERQVQPVEQGQLIKITFQVLDEQAGSAFIIMR